MFANIFSNDDIGAVKTSLTLFEESDCLATWEYTLDVNPNGSPGRILPPDNRKPKAFPSRAFLKSDILDGEARLAAPPLARQGAEFGALHNLADKVMLIGKIN